MPDELNEEQRAALEENCADLAEAIGVDKQTLRAAIDRFIARRDSEVAKGE